jgi:hypothetical protein
MPPLTPDVLIGYYEAEDPEFDPAPLQGIERVDWASVTHAHGKATDVPALLRALVSDEPDHRDFACQLLFETIWHQGDVYPATAETIPFLYNLLDAEGLHDKASVAHLLATIADGHPPLSGCEGNQKETEMWREILRKEGRSLDHELEQGRKFHDRIMREIAERLDLLYPYLRHPEAEIRRSMVVAIGKFPEVVKRVSPDLESALRSESDKYVRAALEETLSRRTKGCC